MISAWVLVISLWGSPSGAPAMTTLPMVDEKRCHEAADQMAALYRKRRETYAVACVRTGY